MAMIHTLLPSFCIISYGYIEFFLHISCTGKQLIQCKVDNAIHTLNNWAQLFKTWITYPLDYSLSSTANVIPFDAFGKISAQAND